MIVNGMRHPLILISRKSRPYMSGADAEGALMMGYLVVLVLSILLYGRFSIASCELTCFGIRCTDESDTSKVQDLIDTIDNTSSVIKD